MSLSERKIEEIKKEDGTILKNRIQHKTAAIQVKQKELDKAETLLVSIGEKWINNEIKQDTYKRWHDDLTRKIISLKSQIDRVGADEDELYTMMNENMDRLKDLRGVFEGAPLSKKHIMIKQGFDCNLYYKNGLYRTPTLLKSLGHNVLKMREEKLLELDKNEEGDPAVPSSGAEGSRTPVQT